MLLRLRLVFLHYLQLLIDPPVPLEVGETLKVRRGGDRRRGPTEARRGQSARDPPLLARALPPLARALPT